MEGHFLCTRLLLEIAGGAVVTAPFIEDLRSEEMAGDVEKYFRGAEPDSAWERLKVLKFIRDIAASEYGGYWNAEIIHGSGSPAAEMLQLYREHDLDRCKELVARAMTGMAATTVEASRSTRRQPRRTGSSRASRAPSATSPRNAGSASRSCSATRMS
jgi:4-hydroxybutyryl-CoA dehydratase/vinylacetyl-CoA-Delta-isomerase